MKAIQCCYFLALVSSHLMAGVMGDDNIFLSNSDSAALYCVAKIFPDGENILIYKAVFNLLQWRRQPQPPPQPIQKVNTDAPPQAQVR